MVNLVLGFHYIVLWDFFFFTVYIVFCNSMKYICVPVSKEILCNFIQTQRKHFLYLSLPFPSVSEGNLLPSGQSLHSTYIYLCLNPLFWSFPWGTLLVGLLSKFSSSWFAFETSSSSSSVLGIVRVVSCLDFSSLWSSTSTPASTSSSGDIRWACRAFG